ncbi:LOW QUALITY PROTEIN: golgin subfamily B member 1-like [Venturia canescens]|uniref:LOW QUALITY PROTEIN: golgin subfamily B member 1-like n=1 Tax=Venturia canescens TaxID=32260 RepID=UPI001C9C7FBC|nr:LOW QUALITY PROTEIN: golgin subfamily B member 1-like [Venturia canescens]
MSSDSDNAQGSARGNVMSEHIHEVDSHICTAINESTGNICGETEGLRILDQFRQIYEARIDKIERDEATGTAADFIPLKLSVMKEWIKDLGEQNVMLVRTVEELEQAACFRVKILEEKLRETAGIVSEKMSRLTKPSEDTVNSLSSRINELEREEEILQAKIEVLQSDIRGLLELIRRARCENCWSIEGIKFYGIVPEQIASPPVCPCSEELSENESIESLKRQLEVLSNNEKKARKYQAELEQKVSDLDNKLIVREESLKKYISMLESLRDNLKKRSTRNNQSFQGTRHSNNDLEFDIASIVEMVESAIATRREEDRGDHHAEVELAEKRNFNNKEVEELRLKLQEKSLEIERLSRRLSFLEKESLETREALTNEVAEKHDMGIALRAEVTALEEQCRRANMLMQFKEDIIKGMRRELKQHSSTKGPGSSGRKVRINADVVYCDQAADSETKTSSNRNESSLVSDLTKAKASWRRENEALHYLRSELEEVLEELHNKERQNYERDMASAQTKLKDIGTLLDNYKSDVIDRNDTKREGKQTDDKITIQKLTKSIANLSKVCAENSNGIVLLERALENSEKNEPVFSHEARVTREFNERWKWDVFDRQFNAMEEFRVCTVEAQAATENLREEMEIAVCNLQTRHQQYLGLSSVVKQMQNLLARTKENVSSVMSHLEQQEHDKMRYHEKIASGEMKLKDLKNEINKVRMEHSRDVVDLASQQKTVSSMTEPNSSRNVIDRVVDIVEQVASHLRVLQAQEQCGTTLLTELRGQLNTMERNLNDVQNETDRVLSDNEIAHKVFNEKIERLDKFEKELDYAHTKMQDTLESIVQSKQRMIDVGVCNLCSCTPSDTAMSGPETASRHEEYHKNSSKDVEQLKNALRSKEKLIEDKDEIIRIQKDSITMTHVELKDLHQKMQAKIDAQNIAIAQHVEEKKLLLEQSKLQSQTIGHLREAVVEAKKNLATKHQPSQKSVIDLSVSEVWNPITPTIFNSSDVHDVYMVRTCENFIPSIFLAYINSLLKVFQACDKDEVIRVLTLFLRETQTQYNDCFAEVSFHFNILFVPQTLFSTHFYQSIDSLIQTFRLKAAEQDTRLELHREAIESLQKTIIHKDLAYYSLLIKAQAFFRGRIGDIRLVRAKLDSLVKSKKCLEDKCRRIKRLWREADRELRKIKCIGICESHPQKSYCEKCSTCADGIELAENTEMESKVDFLMRENEDLKRQLKSRRLEADIFDEEVKNQLDEHNRSQELAKGSDNTENCPVNGQVDLELVLKKHLAYACALIEELQLARDRGSMKTDSTTLDQANLNCTSIKDELQRRNAELDKLIEEAREKQEELAMLQDMRKQFEKSEHLERMNECLKKELSELRKTTESACCVRDQGENYSNSLNTEDSKITTCNRNSNPEEREMYVIGELKEQLSSTRELTEDCLTELRVSKEMLSFLRERICSLKKLLKKKSDEMAKLQADHQMIKNDYSIMKTENSIFAEKARAEIREFREKLKALQSELHIVDENYQRVSEDFDKSQKLLIEAARREVELQRGITTMEQIFYTKLSCAEREGKRLSDLVDILRSDLESAREELTIREENLTEKCQDAYDQVEILEDQVALLDESKNSLTRQLQECRLENCKLIAENARLMENSCKCVKKLEDTHNALLELRGECKTKTQTLNSISAELNHVAASRSELCDESQRVVACIRAWIEEQRKLVENLSKKLKNEKNRISRYAFEKKALVATVKELSRVNGTLSEFSMRRKACQGHSPNRRYARSNGYQSSTSYSRSQKPVTSSSATVYTRPLKVRCHILFQAISLCVGNTRDEKNSTIIKRHRYPRLQKKIINFQRRCVCLTKTSRRTLLRGNSWWFPKLEHVSKELCRKNRRHEAKMNEGWLSDTSMDEARDFGYQSSASK